MVSATYKVETDLETIMRETDQHGSGSNIKKFRKMFRRGEHRNDSGSSSSGYSKSRNCNCYYCGEPSHTQWKCPKKNRNTTSSGASFSRAPPPQQALLIGLNHSKLTEVNHLVAVVEVNVKMEVVLVFLHM